MGESLQFIGIDIGSTFLKGAVLNLDSWRLEHIEREPCPAIASDLPPGYHEIDPLQLTAAADRLLHRLLQQAPTCSGVVLSGQMHGLVLTGEAGAPLANAITWQDQRTMSIMPEGGSTYFAALADQLDAATRIELGQEIYPGRPLFVLYMLQAQGRLPIGCTPASIPGYVAASLCRAKVKEEPTNAAASGAFNLTKGRWHMDLLRRLQLDHLRWPPVQPFYRRVGSLRVRKRSIPIFTPVGDQQAALLGAGIVPGILSINVATGSQVSMVTRQFAPGDYQTRPFFDGMYLNTITHIPAGRALNVLVKLLSELAEAQGTPLADPWPAISRATAATPQTDLQVDLSFFAGGRDADNNGGAITHIHEGNLSAGHLFRAAFVDMAARYQACAERLSPAHDWQYVVLSGGLAHSQPALSILIAQRLGAHLFSIAKEDALRGLMALALVCTGQFYEAEKAAKALPPVRE